jgi:hypothetical protein
LCLENIAPLKFLDNKNWLIITYEDLVLNGEDTVQRLYNFLDLEDYNLAIKQLSRPSRTTVDAKTKNKIKEDKKDYLIKKWENQISEEEREKAFCIINKFGLDVYDKESYFIDYNYLNQN